MPNLFHNHIQLAEIRMSSLAPRLLTRSVRQVCKNQVPRAALNASVRHASTKHPKGFTPPSQADLDELRESVREFTR